MFNSGNSTSYFVTNSPIFPAESNLPPLVFQFFFSIFQLKQTPLYSSTFPHYFEETISGFKHGRRNFVTTSQKERKVINSSPFFFLYSHLFSDICKISLNSYSFQSDPRMCLLFWCEMTYLMLDRGIFVNMKTVLSLSD